MLNTRLTDVLELELPDLPRVFDTALLDAHAQNVLGDLERMLETGTLLQHTRLVHVFSMARDDRQMPRLKIVIGLELINQCALDFQFHTMTLGELELSALDDRQRLVNACKNLPTQNTLVSQEVSRRIAAACLDIPIESLQPEVSRRLKNLLGIQRRNLQGTLTGDPWQQELPALPKFDWRRELYRVRALLHREKFGYTLSLLQRDQLCDDLRHISKLRMHERPSSIELTRSLEQAEHTRSPVDIVIRVGSRVGSDQLVVADFVRFSRPSTCESRPQGSGKAIAPSRP